MPLLYEMRYYIRVVIGVLISLVCLGFALYALYQLVRGSSRSSLRTFFNQHVENARPAPTDR